ncbi:glycosyltransferase [Acinetobacter indicus]|uniref:glycosyltransferase family 2 protein n=1 Tax=Acinetobacter TaxID=469 RepID=UPI000CEC5FC9|nr:MULTISPECIES: glycosyltransferase [Acinetobacter]QFS18184.1 glycosyltransferase [Acinetobacter indicus]UNW03819.1 glycosyltransferase [Acinetobacter indicus]
MSASHPYVLSIIIPVYGVEDYIEACIASLLPQLKDNVECVVVDDGCKDRSIEILRAYLAEHEYLGNIRIISQENQGLSMARNNGYAVSQGQYITFLDSDDFVASDYIAKILTAIKQEPEAELIHFNAEMEDSSYTLRPLVLAPQTGKVLTDADYLKNMFHRNKWYAWLRVYKRELLENFSFPKGYLYEDMLSIPFLYREGMLIYELAEPLLTYRYRPSSITNCQVNPKQLSSLEYGVSLYREQRDAAHFQEVYIHLIMGLFENYLKLGFQNYMQFLQRMLQDLYYLNDKVQHIHWKKRLMLQRPKLFYWYKNWLGLRRYF